jgi:hypothetical protein
VGGAPARYDGGLSYILDLRTRAPRRDPLRGGGSLDLMSAQASLEGPLGSHAGVLLAGRALHNASAALWGGEGSPYGYADGLVRIAAEPAPGHRLGVTAFANRESVFLDLGSTLGVPGPEAARWGNGALSLGYQGNVGATQLDVTAAGTRYDAELPVPPTKEDSVGGRAAPTLARGQTDRLRVGMDISRSFARGTLRFGGSADRTRVEYGASRLPEQTPPASTVSAVSASGTVGGGYVDLTTPASASVNVRVGLRADGFSSDRRLRWAPRAALYWTLSDDALLTLAAGRYHQHTSASDEEVQGTVAEIAGGGPAAPTPGGGSSTRSTAALLPVATADHLVLSLDQQLDPRTRLGLQGFLKGFSDLEGPATSMTSSGLDLRLVREGKQLTGWLGYSLAWFWSADRASASTSEFTGRHLLSAGVTGRLAGPLGMDLRVAFSDGLPYTSVQLAAEDAAESSFVPPGRTGRPLNTDSFGTNTPALAGGPTDSFLRIDAELHADLGPGLRPYVKVLNALDRRDALFWYFEPWRDPEVRPLAKLELLPIVGLEWRF